MVELAFSILAADFAHLADEIARAERGGGTIVHVDVMDGHFVPNITFGPPVVEAIRPSHQAAAGLPPDDRGPGRVHSGLRQGRRGHDQRPVGGLPAPEPDAAAHHRPQRAAGVVINPATPVDFLVEVLPMVHHVLVMSVNPGFGGQKFLPRSVERIAHLRRLRHEMGLNFRIEVDGGVADDTVESVVRAGADMLVAGSAIFAHGKAEENAREFLRIARRAAEVSV